MYDMKERRPSATASKIMNVLNNGYVRVGGLTPCIDSEDGPIPQIDHPLRLESPTVNASAPIFGGGYIL